MIAALELCGVLTLGSRLEKCQSLTVSALASNQNDVKGAWPHTWPQQLPKEFLILGKFLLSRMDKFPFILQMFPYVKA